MEKAKTELSGYQLSSSLTPIPVHVTNIRKTRPSPGILAQHLAAIKIAGEFTDAKIKGNTIGSKDLELVPRVVADLAVRSLLL